MIVGDKSRFAIEFELDAGKLKDPELSEWLFGRTRWWVSGEAIGRWEDDTTLRDLATAAEHFLEYEGHRRDDECFVLSTEELHRRIYLALHDDHGQPEKQVRADEDRYRRFDIMPGIGEFDPWAIYLIEGDDRARLIWRRWDASDLHECILRPGEFDDVLRGFLHALQESAEQLD